MIKPFYLQFNKKVLYFIKFRSKIYMYFVFYQGSEHMKKKTCLIIYNPRSGKGKVKEKIYPYTSSSLSTLKLWVGFGVILKRNNCLNIPNPINKLRRIYIQKWLQRR